MNNFKSNLNTFFKILFCTSLASIPNLSLIEAKAEDFSFGIESVGSDSLRVLKLKRTVYVGECPGIRNKTTEGYFVDYETPVQEDYVVVLQNFTKGLSPNNPPSVKKDYDSGRASDRIKFKIGTKRTKVYLSMQPGKNTIKYQIINAADRKDLKLIKSGIFAVDVQFVDSVFRRDKQYSRESGTYYCPFF